MATPDSRRPPRVDPAFARFLSTATAAPEPSWDEIFEFHRDELLDRAHALRSIRQDACGASAASSEWANALCKALRSPRRIERWAAELALRNVHEQLVAAQDRKPADEDD